MAGVTPWAPVTDREAESRALEGAPAVAAHAAAGPGGFAEHLDEAPVILVVLADLTRLAATDRDLDRYTLVGGASIYPFVWSILLAARGEGLGGVMTTMATAQNQRSARCCTPRTTSRWRVWSRWAGPSGRFASSHALPWRTSLPSTTSTGCPWWDRDRRHGARIAQGTP